jgi:hypothetical protein
MMVRRTLVREERVVVMMISCHSMHHWETVMTMVNLVVGDRVRCVIHTREGSPAAPPVNVEYAYEIFGFRE